MKTWQYLRPGDGGSEHRLGTPEKETVEDNSRGKMSCKPVLRNSWDVARTKEIVVVQPTLHHVPLMVQLIQGK